MARPFWFSLAFALLGLWYSLVIPAFETPDEIYHYAFARHLAQGNGLPIQTIEADGPWEHEGTQAPLYYLILGRLLANVDQSDFDQVGHINPRANLGTPTYPGNKNFMLYSAVPRPLTGTNLAVHIGRWFSLLLSLGTLWFTFGIARLAFPRSPTLALLVMITVAAIPQFAFIGASVSNDPLIILVATATLYWMLVLLRRDITAPISFGDWSILGLLLSLAAISKLQGSEPLCAGRGCGAAALLATARLATFCPGRVDSGHQLCDDCRVVVLAQLSALSGHLCHWPTVGDRGVAHRIPDVGCLLG